MPAWSTLEMGYFDNSPSSQVTATLVRLDPCTGSLNTLCTVTSVDSGAITCRRCTFTGPLDFTRYVYYVSVDLNRSSTAVSPKLFGLRIF